MDVFRSLPPHIRGLQAVPEGGVLGAFEPVVGGSEWRRQLSAYTGEVAGCVLGNVLGVLGSQLYPPNTLCLQGWGCAGSCI